MSTTPTMTSNVVLHSSPSHRKCTQSTRKAGPSKDVKMSFSPGDPIPLSARFAAIKQRLVEGKETCIEESWHRLLLALQKEIDHVASAPDEVIPTIGFHELGHSARVQSFGEQLKQRGVAVIRGVVSRETALGWKQEARVYMASNPPTRTLSTRDRQLYELFWSRPQIEARAHPNMIVAQRFAMSFWDSSQDATALSTDFPVTYADRLRIRTMCELNGSVHPHVDGGSVERWEPDGYGAAGTYDKIFEGRWEEYDPWESTSRLRVNSDLYNGLGSCSVFRMFQGWLSMSTMAPGEGSLLVCPMLRLATAYLLLRPFFSPRIAAGDGFLHPTNWALDIPQSSILHGALPGCSQELSTLLHPHLQLERSMVHIPKLAPGDYVIWHCDAVHAVDATHRGPLDSSVMYIPACPLTPTNALFLTRQRKTFLLGHPGPDFERSRGESHYTGRPGVEEINEAGGEEALRAMGLLPWDEELANSVEELHVLRNANAILFPEMFGML